MKKIIKLLREYKPSEYDYVEHDGGIFNRETDSTGEYNRYFDLEPVIISKKFGFIQWLVEHQKIDLFIPKQYFFDKIFSDTYEGDFVCEVYEIVIIVLSIQDNPIEFLISILK